MAKKYVLKLTPQERNELERVTQGGVAAVRKVQKARSLLLCDQGENGPAWKDEEHRSGRRDHSSQSGKLATTSL